MKTAVLSPKPMSPRPASAAAAANAWAQTQPACWRSEAFAEDLLDTQTPAGSDPGRRPPLLRRALAAVLRR
jgi:hypothetical protein